MAQKKRYTNKQVKNAWLVEYNLTLRQEKLWWGWFRCVSIPLIALAFAMKLFGPANPLLSWPVLIFLVLLLIVCRIFLVWHFQKYRKKAQARINELQREIDAGNVWFEKKEIKGK